MTATTQTAKSTAQSRKADTIKRVRTLAGATQLRVSAYKALISADAEFSHEIFETVALIRGAAATLRKEREKIMSLIDQEESDEG